MSYNGWSNYETWLVKLWMDTEEGSYRYWTDTAEGLAKHELAELLKEYHEEYRPDLGASVWADMLNAAFSEVDWGEIADNLLEDCEFETEESEA